ncbi:MAG: phage holin family protein [Ruminococcus sp.]|nr:phage holin family protein [Ruminococcus sp.]
MKFTVSSVIGAVGGFFAWFMGGIDTLLVTLITFMVIDYVTGVIRAIYEKKLSSAIGFRGIIKKMLMLILVGVAVSLGNIMPVGVPLREMTVMFFIANEGFSILENAAGVIPLPDKLKSVLLQLQKKAEDKDFEDKTK